jgi:hypothetical protein
VLSKLLPLVLTGVLIALAPLADAAPPDPTWIGGFYDADDFDEVVMAVLDGMAVVGSVSLRPDHSSPPRPSAVPSAGRPAPASPGVAPIRAPPVS